MSLGQRIARLERAVGMTGPCLVCKGRGSTRYIVDSNDQEKIILAGCTNWGAIADVNRRVTEGGKPAKNPLHSHPWRSHHSTPMPLDG